MNNSDVKCCEVIPLAITDAVGKNLTRLINVANKKVLVTKSDTFSASDEMVDASVVDLFFDIQYLVGRIYRTYYLMKPVCMRQRRQH